MINVCITGHHPNKLYGYNMNNSKYDCYNNDNNNKSGTSNCYNYAKNKKDKDIILIDPVSFNVTIIKKMKKERYISINFYCYK